MQAQTASQTLHARRQTLHTVTRTPSPAPTRPAPLVQQRPVCSASALLEDAKCRLRMMSSQQPDDSSPTALGNQPRSGPWSGGRQKPGHPDCMQRGPSSCDVDEASGLKHAGRAPLFCVPAVSASRVRLPLVASRVRLPLVWSPVSRVDLPLVWICLSCGSASRLHRRPLFCLAAPLVCVVCLSSHVCPSLLHRLAFHSSLRLPCLPGMSALQIIGEWSTFEGDIRRMTKETYHTRDERR